MVDFQTKKCEKHCYGFLASFVGHNNGVIFFIVYSQLVVEKGSYSVFGVN